MRTLLLPIVRLFLLLDERRIRGQQQQQRDSRLREVDVPLLHRTEVLVEDDAEGLAEDREHELDPDDDMSTSPSDGGGWSDVATVIVAAPQKNMGRRLEILEATMKSIGEASPRLANSLVHLCFDGNAVPLLKTEQYVHVHKNLAHNWTLRETTSLRELKRMSDDLWEKEERFISLERKGNPEFFEGYVPIKNNTKLIKGAHLDERCRKPMNGTLYRDFKRRAKMAARRIFGGFRRDPARGSAALDERNRPPTSRYNDNLHVNMTAEKHDHPRIRRRGLRTTYFKDAPNLRMIELVARGCLGSVLNACMAGLPERIKLVHMMQADMPLLRNFLRRGSTNFPGHCSAGGGLVVRLVVGLV
eukprot:g11051.t1